VAVDTLGLIWALSVTPANVPDWDGAKEVLLRLMRAAPRVEVVFADSAYRAITRWGVWFARVVIRVVSKTPGQVGFVVQPKRWIVERTFGWFGRWRRLSKDYERTTESSEAFIYVAMIGVMARRLQPPKPG
jgi:putative transposase